MSSKAAFLRPSRPHGSTTHNVFFTMAMKEIRDSQGYTVESKPDIKGNATLGSIQRLCPVIMHAVAEVYETDEGTTRVDRKLVTGYKKVIAGRVDHFLDGENPDVIEADLSKVLTLLGE